MLPKQHITNRLRGILRLSFAKMKTMPTLSLQLHRQIHFSSQPCPTVSLKVSAKPLWLSCGSSECTSQSPPTIFATAVCGHARVNEPWCPVCTERALKEHSDIVERANRHQNVRDKVKELRMTPREALKRYQVLETAAMKNGKFFRSAPRTQSTRSGPMSRDKPLNSHKNAKH